MLLIDSLSKRLGSRRVLHGVGLAFEGPGTVWIRGPNGGGKSTLMKCIAGLWRPDSGDVWVMGRSTVRDGRARSQIGYLPDRVDELPELTVADLFSLIAALKRSSRPDSSLLVRTGVDGYLHRRFNQLSAGQKQRAALVVALIGDPWLLVLDEPTTGLDQDGILMMRDLLLERHRSGKAALLVTHDHMFANQVALVTYDLVSGNLLPRPLGQT